MLLRIGLYQIRLSVQLDGAAHRIERPSFQDGSALKAETILNRRKDQAFHGPPHARQA